MLESIIGLDQELLVLINQQLHFRALKGVMGLLASDPLYVGLGLGVVIAYLYIKGRQGIPLLLLAGAIIGSCILTTDFIAAKVKGATERDRPYHSLPNVHHIRNASWQQNPPDFTPDGARNYSFYSGHATNSMALAGALVTIYPPAAPAAVIFSLLVGYSRVYVGKHFPFDVVCGWITGLGIGWLFGRTFPYARKRLRI